MTDIRQWLTPGNREEWLDYRKPDITSTDTAALFGLSPYKTKFELYHKHVSGIEPEFKVTDRMEKGNALEFAVAQLAAEQEGWADLKPLKQYCRIADDRIGSSFDCEAIDKDRKPLLIEIKLVDTFRYRDTWIDGEAPEHIEVQVQHELELADRFERAAIVAWSGAYDCNVIYRDRDREFGDAIRQAVREFWAMCEAMQEPDPDFTRDDKVIAAMFKNTRPDPVDKTDDVDLEALIRKYELANMQKIEFEKSAKALKAELHYAIGDAAEVYTNGYRIKAGWTKDVEGRVAEPGEIIGARKGYRRCDVKSLMKGE